jgi:hypothetical protein
VRCAEFLCSHTVRPDRVAVVEHSHAPRELATGRVPREHHLLQVREAILVSRETRNQKLNTVDCSQLCGVVVEEMV